MTDVLSRLKGVIKEEPKIELTQVCTEKETGTDEEVNQTDIVVQQISEHKVIKKNNPGTPTMGFTLEVLGLQFGLAVEKAMHIAGVTSVEASFFGIFDEIGILPENFDIIEDPYIGKRFYVLKNANRLTEIYKTLAKAISSTNVEVISFPYTMEHTLKLPLKYHQKSNEFSDVGVTVESLYLTPSEIDNLNHAFIQEVQYCGKIAEQGDSIDLISFKIDREEWKAAPYRV